MGTYIKKFETISEYNEYMASNDVILPNVSLISGKDKYEIHFGKLTVDISNGIPNAAKDYDGNTYMATIIGDQVWLAEDLRTTHYADGTSIPQLNKNQQETNGYIDMRSFTAFNIFSGVTKNILFYGQSVAVSNKGLISNWRTPTSADTQTMLMYVAQTYPEYKRTDGNWPGSYIRAAKAFASVDYWNDYSEDNYPNPGSNKSLNNPTKLNILPLGAGIRNVWYDGGEVWHGKEAAGTLGQSGGFWNTTSYKWTFFSEYENSSTPTGSANEGNLLPIRLIYDGSVSDFLNS